MHAKVNTSDGCEQEAVGLLSGDVTTRSSRKRSG